MKVDYLRISVIDRCNLKCVYCHPLCGCDFLRREEILRLEEIERITRLLAKCGIQKIRLTGGEPLIREDIVEIVKRIESYVEEVSMTTNASKLSDLACKLREAGLARVNISLHSLNPSKFKEITGTNLENVVEEGVGEAIKCGLTPVKLNMVVMKGINEGEIPQMINFSKDFGITLQLIEYQPLERGVADWSEYHYDLKPIEDELEVHSTSIVNREMHRRRQYHLKDGGVVEVVRPMHNSNFCQYCTRLRLTSDGNLKPCLMREDNHVQAVSLLRNGGDRESILAAFLDAVAKREPFWS